MKKFKVVDVVKEMINESGLSRIYSFVESTDIAILSAWRVQNINCVPEGYSEEYPEGYQFNFKEKEKRNKELQSVLLRLNYGVTKIKGSWVENFKTPVEKEVLENSFFVANLNDDPGFINNIIKLGKLYCQDAVLIKPKGEDAYLYGTNYFNYPGYEQKVIYSKTKFYGGREDIQFFSRVKGRPFYFKEEKEYNALLKLEKFCDCQNVSKYLISELSKNIIEKIKKIK